MLLLLDSLVHPTSGSRPTLGCHRGMLEPRLKVRVGWGHLWVPFVRQSLAHMRGKYTEQTLGFLFQHSRRCSALGEGQRKGVCWGVGVGG